MTEGTDAAVSLRPTRVVAGLDENGTATVLSQATPGCLKNMHGVEIAELWRFDGPSPGATDGGDPACGDDWNLWAPLGGAAWRLVKFTTSSPEIHATPTIDMVVVIEGQIELVLEDGPVLLGLHDAAVIQGCLHGWQLVDDEPCTLVALMITIPE